MIQKDVNDQVRGKDTIHREESLAQLKEKMDSKHMEAQLNDNSEWKEEMEGALNVLSKVGDHVQSLLNPHTAHTDAVFGIVAVGAGSHNFVTSSWDGHLKFWRLNEDTASFELERDHELRDGSMTLAACMHKDYLGDSLECVGGERLDALVSGQFDGSTATIRLVDQDNEIDVCYDEHDSKTAGEHQHRLKPTSVTVVAALHTTTKAETKTEDQPVLHREDLESPPDACQIRVAIATKAGQIHLIHPPRAHQPMSAGKLVQKWEQLGNKANTVRAMTWLQNDGDLHAMLYVACGEDIIALRWESEPADGQELRICLEETHKNVGGVVSALVVAHWYGHSNGTQESCLVSAVGKTVVVWERAGRKRASYTINSKGGVTSLAWLPNPQFIEVNSDKGWIAIGDGDGVITLWDYSKNSFPNSANSTGVLTIRLDQDTAAHSVLSLCWLPLNGWLVSGRRDGSVNVWRIRVGTNTTRLAVTNSAKRNWRALRRHASKRDSSKLSQVTEQAERSAEISERRARLVGEAEAELTPKTPPAETPAAVLDLLGTQPEPEPAPAPRQNVSSVQTAAAVTSAEMMMANSIVSTAPPKSLAAALPPLKGNLIPSKGNSSGNSSAPGSAYVVPLSSECTTEVGSDSTLADSQPLEVKSKGRPARKLPIKPAVI
eukprot:COSAG05_NODE_749_length_7548_cov_9.496442_7_plen_661_part_00